MNAREIWESEVTRLANERGCSRTDAWSFCCVLAPELYKAYQAEAAEANRVRMSNIQPSFTTGRTLANIGQASSIRRLIPGWALSGLGINDGTNDAQAIYLLSKCSEKFDSDQGLKLALEMARKLMEVDQVDEPTAVARLKDTAPEVGKFFGKRTTLENSSSERHVRMLGPAVLLKRATKPEFIG